MKEHEFRIFPIIIPADKHTEIVIKPRDEQNYFKHNTKYEIKCAGMEEIGSPSGYTIKPTVTENEIRFKSSFPGEQEHVIFLNEVHKDKHLTLEEFRVYSLSKDLFELNPYKGDFHIHSNRSDGKDDPGFVAGACREIGLDFMALTDHGRYKPSLEAIDAFAHVPIDLKIFPGEEIHPPDNRVHMINFGGHFSVNDLFKNKSYMTEIKAIAEKEQCDLPDKEHLQYASCVWCYRKIREAGGLAIFCHPYWISGHTYNVPESITAKHFKDMPFDAFELIGGFHLHEVESNMLQTARYHSESGKGRKIPIVGVSDAHGCRTGSLFGWYYTIIFSESLALQDIIKAVRDCRAVAVEALPDQTPRTHGPFRLVKYAQFLLREAFPYHDELCRKEGELMLSYLSGNTDAAAELDKLKGQTDKLMASFYGRQENYRD